MTSMTIARWYGRSVRVPAYYQANYNSFLFSCLGIVRSIVEDNIGKRISLRFVETGTASADQERQLININHKYIRGDFDLPTGNVESDTALSAILGIIVHEAAHFAWSPATLEPFAEYVKENTRCIYNEKLAATLGNIVEDIYIEAEVDRSIPSLSWMLESINELLFPDNTQHKALNHAKDIVEAPDNMLDVVKVMDALLLAKLHPSILSTSYVESLFTEIRSATHAVRLHERKCLVLSIYEQLMCNITQQEEEENGADKSLDGLSKKAKGLSGDKMPSSEDVPHDVIVRKLNRELEELEKTKTEVTPAEVNHYGFRPTEVYMEKVMELGSPIEMDVRYQKLAEVGRQRAVVNRPYGEQRNRGTNIRNLHRIATDSRIFAEPVAMNNYKPMQVIVLVDASGSMEHEVYGSGVTRLQAASGAALGAAYGLSHAHCDVAVYAHTAELLGGSEVNIYRLKSFSEPLNLVAARFGHMIVNENTSQNRDGYAIRYIAKKFQDKRKRRLLIVISDGQPWASHGYMGEPAIQHTQEMVSKVRAEGIDILSISITEEAREANNRIYGSAWNTYNQDPNVIEDVVRTLITK